MKNEKLKKKETSRAQNDQARCESEYLLAGANVDNYRRFISLLIDFSPPQRGVFLHELFPSTSNNLQFSFSVWLKY